MFLPLKLIVLMSTMFISYTSYAETSADIETRALLCEKSPILAVASLVLQAYPAEEKETAADVFVVEDAETDEEIDATEKTEEQLEKERKRKEKENMPGPEKFYRFMTNEIMYPSEYDKKKRAYTILSAAEDVEQAFWFKGHVIDSRTWRDLNLFFGSIDYPTFFLGEILSMPHTQTEIGKAYLNGLLARPVDDLKLITFRQNIVQTLLDNDELCKTLGERCAAFAENETMLTGLWGKEQLMQCIKDDCYYKAPLKALKGLVDTANRSPLALDFRATIDTALSGLQFSTKVAGPLIFAAWLSHLAGFETIEKIPGREYIAEYLPRWEWIKDTDTLKKWVEGTFRWNRVMPSMVTAFAILYFWQKDKSNFAQGVAGVGGLAGELWDLPMHWSRFKVGFKYDDFLRRRLIRVTECMRIAQELRTIIPKEMGEKLTFFKYINRFFEELPQINADIDSFINNLHTDTFDTESVDSFSLVFRRGRVFAVYNILDRIKKYLEPVIAAVGELDAFLSIAKMVKTNPERYCLPDFINAASTPSIDLQGFWNPFLDPKNVVLNDISLGLEHDVPHIVVTGPNSGGKSTALKGIGLSVIMAQSLGIAPARAMTLTPFSHLSMYMNIADSIVDKESRFQSEGRQAFAHGDLIKRLYEQGKFSLAIFDEIFSGTSPEEGALWGYRTAAGFARYPNCICAIATHFAQLTNLEADTGGLFVNYKVSIAEDDAGNFVRENGKLKRTYTIERGISDQHIAKEVLQEQGINSPFFQQNFIEAN